MNKFNQRSEKVQKQRKTVKGDQIIIVQSLSIVKDIFNKVHLVKTMVFPVVMYGCERWTIKKAEYRRIDAF